MKSLSLTIHTEVFLADPVAYIILAFTLQDGSNF